MLIRLSLSLSLSLSLTFICIFSWSFCSIYIAIRCTSTSINNTYWYQGRPGLIKTSTKPLCRGQLSKVERCTVPLHFFPLFIYFFTYIYINPLVTPSIHLYTVNSTSRRYKPDQPASHFSHQKSN